MDLFNEIYNLTYLPILTPNNLLDNLKLDNYNSISFKKSEDSIISEINCTINKESVTFYYIFDKDNNLNEAYYYENNNKMFLFNRIQLLESLKQEYLNSNKKINNL